MEMFAFCEDNIILALIHSVWDVDFTLDEGLAQTENGSRKSLLGVG